MCVLLCLASYQAKSATQKPTSYAELIDIDPGSYCYTEQEIATLDEYVETCEQAILEAREYKSLALKLSGVSVDSSFVERHAHFLIPLAALAGFFLGVHFDDRNP